jgi:hypothetical protein
MLRLAECAKLVAIAISGERSRDSRGRASRRDGSIAYLGSRFRACGINMLELVSRAPFASACMESFGALGGANRSSRQQDVRERTLVSRVESSMFGEPAGRSQLA